MRKPYHQTILDLGDGNAEPLKSVLVNLGAISSKDNVDINKLYSKAVETGDNSAYCLCCYLLFDNGADQLIKASIDKAKDSDTQEIINTLCEYKRFYKQNRKQETQEITSEELNLLTLRRWHYDHPKEYDEFMATFQKSYDGDMTFIQNNTFFLAEMLSFNGVKGMMKIVAALFPGNKHYQQSLMDTDGNPLKGRFGKMLVTKDERIEYLEEENESLKKAYQDLVNRLKPVKDLVFALLSLNFRKVIQIILDQWKAGLKEFTKELKEFIQDAMSYETTVENRKRYVEDAFKGAKAIALTDTKWTAKEEALKPLYDDAMRIADGTWESHRQEGQQLKQLLSDAANAVIAVSNTPNKKSFNPVEEASIDAYLAEGGSIDEIWNVAKDNLGTWDEYAKRVLYAYVNGESMRQGLSY